MIVPPSPSPLASNITTVSIEMNSLQDLYDTPGLAPPPGVLPNFSNPVSRADSMRIVSSVSMAVAIGFVILRVYSRLWITRTFGKDDCKQPIKILLYYAYCREIDACVIAMVSRVGEKAQ